MYPPTPTNNPYDLLSNLWLSLSRAGNTNDGGHWAGNATVEPTATGVKATLQLGQHMDEASWEAASKYIRQYARASHWSIHKLSRLKTHVELVMEHSPPKPKSEQHPKQSPAPQKTS